MFQGLLQIYLTIFELPKTNVVYIIRCITEPVKFTHDTNSGKQGYKILLFRKILNKQNIA